MRRILLVIGFLLPGRLKFYKGSKGGTNAQDLEHEAFERGNRFKGYLQTENKKFDYNYTYNWTFPDSKYYKYDYQAVKITKKNESAMIDYYKKLGKEIIYNIPD
jgi:hypothetical protein